MKNIIMGIKETVMKKKIFNRHNSPDLLPLETTRGYLEAIPFSIKDEMLKAVDIYWRNVHTQDWESLAILNGHTLKTEEWANTWDINNYGNSIATWGYKDIINIPKNREKGIQIKCSSCKCHLWQVAGNRHECYPHIAITCGSKLTDAVYTSNGVRYQKVSQGVSGSRTARLWYMQGQSNYNSWGSTTYFTEAEEVVKARTLLRELGYKVV